MTTKINLKYKILVNQVETEALHVRRPSVRDMREFDKPGGDIEKMSRMVEILAGIPADSVEMMDVSDFMAVTEVINGFLDSTPATGATP